MKNDFVRSLIGFLVKEGYDTYVITENDKGERHLINNYGKRVDVIPLGIFGKDIDKIFINRNVGYVYNHLLHVRKGQGGFHGAREVDFSKDFTDNLGDSTTESDNISLVKDDSEVVNIKKVIYRVNINYVESEISYPDYINFTKDQGDEPTYEEIENAIRKYGGSSDTPIYDIIYDIEEAK